MAFEFLNTEQEDNGFYRAGAGKTTEVGPKFSGLGEDTGQSEEAGQGPEQVPFQDATAGTDDKVKAAKAHATIEKGYAQAQKALTVYRSPYERMQVGMSGKDLNDIDGIKARIEADTARSKAANHADDLRNVANRPGIPPEFAQQWSDAADSMLDANTAKAQLDQMRAPGGPLALSQQEQQTAQASIPGIDKQINDLTQQAQTQGQFNQRQTYAKINQLKQQKQRVLDMQGPVGSDGKPLDTEVGINEVATAAGVPRHEIIQANTEMRRMVQAHGVDVNAKVTPMTFPLVVTNLVSSMFNPAKAAQLLTEMLPEKTENPELPEGPGEAPPKEGGKPAPKPSGAYGGQPGLEQDPRFQNVSNQISQRESRRQQIWSDLRNSKTFNNVGDVLGFIVCSVLIGAQNAAHIFTNMDKVGNLRWELDKLDHETTALYHQQDSYIQLSQHARAQAAAEDKDATNTAETLRHHQAVENYMNARAKVPHGRDQTLDALMQGLRTHTGNIMLLEKKKSDLEAKANMLSTMKGYSKEEQMMAKAQLPGIHRDLDKAREDHQTLQKNIQKRVNELVKQGLLHPDQATELNGGHPKAVAPPPQGAFEIPE